MRPRPKAPITLLFLAGIPLLAQTQQQPPGFTEKVEVNAASASLSPSKRRDRSPSSTMTRWHLSDGRHRLGAYLERLASDTGGLYNETFDFPDLARLRVERSPDGSYELVFRDPAPGRGWHEVEIALTGRAGTALFPRWYRDGPDVSSR